MALLKRFLEGIKEDLTPEELFILALYLSHKRLVHWRGEITKEKEKMVVFEMPETEEVFSLPRLNLESLNIEAIKSSLANKFA